MTDRHDVNESVISQELADQMLQNIFEACNVEPNTIRLEDLETYSNYRRDRFALRKILIRIILVLFLLVPVLFISPKIVAVQQTADQSPTYNVSVESVLPVLSVKASINGKDVPVYEKQRRVYTLEPGEEGTMNVTVTILNHQYIQKKIKVTAVDNITPNVVSSSRKGDSLHLYVTDNASGVDYDLVYATTRSGMKTKPLSIDEKKGLVIFKYPSESVNIFVPDKAGNQLQLLLTV